MAAELLMGPAPSEGHLVRIAVGLGAATTGGPLSVGEKRAVEQAMELEPPDRDTLGAALDAINAGRDPLGEQLCRLRSPAQRRSIGAFYTPAALVEPMVDWVLKARPERLVDAGCGSGRFAAAAARRDAALQIVAVDLDPVATLLTRAALAVLGARHALVLQRSYMAVRLEAIDGRTAFISNPPYVRHHDLSPAQKAWAARAGMELGCRVSGLAGLHAHFYLATALHARPGDLGCFVTSAEWLDVGYGAVIRDLLLNGLGGQALHVLDSRAVPFDDAQTTAAIACFEVGSRPDAIRIRLVRSLQDVRGLDLGEPITRTALADAARWTPFLSGSESTVDRRQVRTLGSIARVHRGLVTGANQFFVLTRERARALGLERWCRPAITAAREILEADGVILDTPRRKLLLEVPADVDRSAFPALDVYLRAGETAQNGHAAVSDGYICRHRRPWWYLGRHEPPPVVASYMARQAPAFALNPDGLALVNIGHGIYPRPPMNRETLEQLVFRLNAARGSFRGQGRTYQGGLEKFEPRELEALPIDVRGRLNARSATPA